MKQFCEVTLLLVTMGMTYASPDLATFYNETQFRGVIHTVDFAHLRCYNLPKEHEDQASSVSTHGSCIIVYSFSDCTGYSIRISPGTSGHDNLASINFDKNIRSFESCQRFDANSTTASPTPPPTTQTTQPIDIPIENKVEFYDTPDFNGKYFTIYFKTYKCYNLPGHWRNRASSVNTHGSCVTLYDVDDCSGLSTRVAPWTDSHNNLRAIGFDKIVKSFRPCSIT